jgi:hypothetical protein
MSALTIDHVAHFVPDIDGASAALERLGFTLTPFSAQSHRLQQDGPLVPAGTGNRCVMFERGYVEVLTPTHDTPVADQLRTAMKRYVGVHLIAFGTEAPEADHARLARAGFSPLDPVALQRPIGTESGESTARFTVVRVPPGSMSEGRIQFCQHHTPELVWQPRWLTHPNGATGLRSVLVCVEDAPEAAQRYARFTGIAPDRNGEAWTLETARGTLTILSSKTIERVLGLRPPVLPWIAGYVLETRSLEATRDHLQRNRIAIGELGDGRMLVRLPKSLGSAIVFQPEDSDPLPF